MPPIPIMLLPIMILVIIAGLFEYPAATLMALGIGLAVLLAAAIAWRTEVYLNRPSRRR